MTGPEHYREAEKLLESCQVPPKDDQFEVYPPYPAAEEDLNTVGNALRAAQVHATLALAAATALRSFAGGGRLPFGDAKTWYATCAEEA